MKEKQKILVIDDNEDNIKVVASIIKNERNMVWVATKGKIGIEIAKKRMPDLILLDIQMPDMDGFQVCKILKEDEATKKIPIIFMTARTDDESIASAFAAGGVDYITKPFRKQELLARVKTQLELSGTIIQLSDTIEQLEETVAIKNKFFYIIAHDLVGPISGMAELLNLINDEFAEFNVEYIKQIVRNSSNRSTRIYNLLINLLEWSKTQTGLIKFNPVTTNISQLLEEGMAFFDSMILRKKIHLVKKFDENCRVLIDNNIFSVIISNLLSNAIKFSNENGIVEIGFNVYEDFIEFYIKDNGIGMGDEIKEKIFKVGEKITSVGTNGEEGNGLGLYLCNELAKLHYGEIKIESEKGKGSRASFVIQNIIE